MHNLIGQPCRSRRFTLSCLLFTCLGGTCSSPAVVGDVLRGALLVSWQHPATDLKPRPQRPHGGTVQGAPSHLAVPAASAACGPNLCHARPQCCTGTLAHAPSWHAVRRLQVVTGPGFLGGCVEMCRAKVPGGTWWAAGSYLGVSKSASGSWRRGKRGPSSRFSSEAEGSWKPVFALRTLPSCICLSWTGSGGTWPPAPVWREELCQLRGPSCTEGFAPEQFLLVAASFLLARRVKCWGSDLPGRFSAGHGPDFGVP